MSNKPFSRHSMPPGASKSLLQLSRLARLPLERFLQIEAASGILLLFAAAVALIWANSPWSESYRQFWNLPVGIRLGPLAFERSLEWIVNDVLMVIFFFVVGLEIKREIHRGELSEWRRASLPIVAAIGGMILPAFIYLALAHDPSRKSGWGVPMATDIAFAVGVLTLLGERIPPALRVLLLSVAVIDDLGAILVIALFYSSGIAFSGLVLAAGGIFSVFVMQRFGVRSKIAYVAPAIVAWIGIYTAGVHPTIAGVIVGLITPVTEWLGPKGFLKSIAEDLKDLEEAAVVDTPKHKVAGILQHLNLARREVLSPSDSLIETLHPWVAFLIMPIFALANAGVSMGDISFDRNSTIISFAVAMGLLVGKPAGILAISWIAVKLRIATFPKGIHISHILLLGIVAGIGFTMALFIAQLAFTNSSQLTAAKLGVLAASGAAGVIALSFGWIMLTPKTASEAGLTADEAERSTLK